MAETKKTKKPAAKKAVAKKKAPAKKAAPKKAAPKKAAPKKAPAKKAPAKAPSFDLNVIRTSKPMTFRFATQEQLDEAVRLIKRRTFDLDVRMRGSRRGLPPIIFHTLDGDIRCVSIRLAE